MICTSTFGVRGVRGNLWTGIVQRCAETILAKGASDLLFFPNPTILAKGVSDRIDVEVARVDLACGSELCKALVGCAECEKRLGP